MFWHTSASCQHIFLLPSSPLELPLEDNAAKTHACKTLENPQRLGLVLYNPRRVFVVQLTGTVQHQPIDSGKVCEDDASRLTPGSLSAIKTREELGSGSRVCGPVMQPGSWISPDGWIDDWTWVPGTP
jgi:hypothetical protein